MATLFVLGAGASRAASQVATPPLSCLSPLNPDFFTQLQRITDTKHKTAVENVIADVVELFGSNFALTLEDYFTQLEFFGRAIDLTSKTAELGRSYFTEKRENLMAALAAVLEASTNPIITSSEGCPLHKEIIENLRPGDTVISFNYDCLVDDALRRHGNNKWNPRWGYGFPLRDFSLTGTEHWEPQVPASVRDATITLLKLHGSINWQLPELRGGEIKLKQRLHQQRGVPRFTIVPPVWNKALESELIFRKLWQEAAPRIRAASTIAVIGFSFVPTDLYVQSLFQVAFLKRPGTRRRLNLKRLVIVNPDKKARHRIRQVFDMPLLEPGTIVRQYHDFQEFVGALPEAAT